jgi:hypothetical protein
MLHARDTEQGKLQSRWPDPQATTSVFRQWYPDMNRIHRIPQKPEKFHKFHIFALYRAREAITLIAVIGDYL